MSVCVGRRPHSLFEEPWTGVETRTLSPGSLCDTGDAPANFLCELDGHDIPCASCLNGKWVEDVSSSQLGHFVLGCFVSCCTWFGRCVTHVGLCISVWHCYVSCHGFTFSPGQESRPIRPFVITSHQTGWFFNCRHLGSLDYSPYDVIQMATISVCERCQLAVAHDTGTNSSRSGTWDGRGQFRDWQP